MNHFVVHLVVSNNYSVVTLKGNLLFTIINRFKSVNNGILTIAIFIASVYDKNNLAS